MHTAKTSFLANECYSHFTWLFPYGLSPPKVLFTVQDSTLKKNIMKKLLLLFAFFAFFNLVQAQSIERSVIGNAGQTFSANGAFITYTIGEAVILPSPSITFSPLTNATMFTIGFIQPHVAQIGALVLSYNWVSAYPNPTTGWVRLDIHGDNFQINNVRITNMLGQQVAVKPFKMINGSLDLDFSSLSSGIYIVSVTDNVVGRTVSTKIVKQNK